MQARYILAGLHYNLKGKIMVHIIAYLHSNLGNIIITFAHASPFLFTGLLVCFFAIGIAFTMPKK
jgi:hypothetical protein